jgi:hypothetical protein
MHKMILTVTALFSISLGAMENTPEIIIEEFVQHQLKTSYEGWPKIFQNETYTAYFKEEVRNIFTQMDPHTMAYIKQPNNTIIKMPLGICILCSLMNPKPLPNKSFNFQFANWKRTIERIKKGTIHSDDFVFITVKKKPKVQQTTL